MRKHRHKHKKPTRQHRSHRSQRTLKSSYLIKRLKYFPAIAITLAASVLWAQPQFGFLQHDRGVLAYATNVSVAGLLDATNTQRSANSVGLLSENAQLNAAAQAKANDMVARDYWSHQTPDGEQPWVFITNAGYHYLSAGENLAYGFMTSSSTVTGWMNSPPHKANLLSPTFTEVGFGIANSPSYVGNGPQTIVVAMYGKPQVLAATPAPAAPQPTKPEPVQSAESTPKAPEPATEETNQEEPAPENNIETEPIAISTIDSDTPVAGSTNVQRIQVMTGGSAVWSATFVILGVCAVGLLWLIHRGFRFRYWLKASERFIGKHLYLDLTVLSIIYLGFVLLSSSGTIR